MIKIILLYRYIALFLLMFAVALPAYAQFADGDGSEGNPYIITTLDQLQEMRDDLQAHYELGNDIDAIDTKDWNEGQGFEPVGTEFNRFQGNFNGNGFTISDLVINRADEVYIGLFGYAENGHLKNAALINFTVSGDNRVGTLAGRNDGLTSNSNSTGTVTGNTNTGGLLGLSNSVVSESYSSVTVNGGNQIGGLVGFNLTDGLIEKSFSTGNVIATGGTIGGLVGPNQGSITNSYATGNVEGSGSVGGLLGTNSGNVSTSFSSGLVTGTNNIGGLIGFNFDTGLTSFGYWNEDVNDQRNGVGNNANATGVTGLTTAQMNGVEASENMLGFNYQDIWLLTDAYPALYFEDVDALDLPDADLPDAITLESPTDASEDVVGNPILTWLAEDNAVIYRIEVASDSNFDTIVRTREGESLSLQLANELDWETTFYWRVRGINNLGQPGDWSAIWTFTTESAPYAGGLGTQEDPYQIETIDQLQIINITDRDKHFIQVSNIDASDTQNWNDGLGFEPIGNVAIPFTGSYDGAGYVISSLFINRPTQNIVGLFGRTDGEFIRNLGLIDVDITGQNDVGGIAGVSSSESTKLYVEGKVKGATNVGGLFGQTFGDAHISESYTKGTIEGVAGNRSRMGGFVGITFGNTMIENSYSQASVISGTSEIGGFAGWHNSGTIRNSFATGTVEGTASTIGGLAGFNAQTFTGSYWNADSSNVAFGGGAGNSSGTSSLTTEQMTGVSALQNMLNFEFPDMWLLTEGYPALYWEDVDTLAIPEFAAPDVIVLVTPAADADSVSVLPSFTWEKDENATIYDIQIATDVDFENNILDATSEDSTYSTSVVLDLTTNFYWRVRGRNPSGPGEWSSTRSFTTMDRMYAGGSGTSEDPYQIETVNQLQFISYFDVDKHFVQTADIDASETAQWNNGNGFLPIGNQSKTFSGIYDGNGHVITDLFINRPGQNIVGLFGYSSAELIQNVGLEDATITGALNVGGLAGVNNGKITKSFAEGTFIGSQNVGGLVGSSQPESHISESYSKGLVEGTGNGGSRMGGLVGLNTTNSNIELSYSQVTVKNGTTEIGGFAGWNNGGTISNVYVTGTLEATGGTVGALAGFNSGSFTNSFWNADSTFRAFGGSNGTADALIDLTTVQMTGVAAIENMLIFDFPEKWLLTEGFPALYWEDVDALEIPQFDPPGSIVLSTPEDDAVDISLKPVYTWEVDDNSIRYILQVSTEVVFDSVLVNSTISNTTFTSTTILEYNSSYFWRVRGEGVSGLGDWSDARSFTTMNHPYAGGAGTVEDPYQVETLDQLQLIGLYDASKNFVQTANIDAEVTRTWNDGAGFAPINNFTGTYDGNGYAISNLFIDRKNNFNLALFGSLTNATVENVTMIDVDITGNLRVGAIAGTLLNSTIRNTRSNGTIVGKTDVGGLVGYMQGTSTLIKEAFTTGVVDSLDTDSNNMGGLVGNSVGGMIQNSYSRSSVSGNGTIGGLVGWNNGGIIRSSYAAGEVSGTTNFGGVTGFNSSVIDSTYWDSEATKQALGFAGSTAQAISNVASFTSEGMTGSSAADSLALLDFENVWVASSVGYPTLRWSVDFAAVVVLTSPANDAEDVTLTPVFDWEESEFTDAYQFQLSADADFEDLILDLTDLIEIQYEVNEELQDGITYYWRVRSGNEYGMSGWSNTSAFTTETIVSTDIDNIPLVYALNQNFPNPFNPTTQITYSIVDQTHVTLEVFDILGRRVSMLVNESKSPGRYQISFDASRMSSGVYIYRLTAGDFTSTRQMMLVK